MGRGVPNFSSGFMEGYGFVSDVKQRRHENKRANKRLDLEQERLQHSMALDEQQSERANEQLELSRERLSHRKKQSKIENERQDRSLDIQSRSHALDRRQQELEIAEARREQRERERRETLQAAATELENNGVTPRFRDLAQRADVPVDKFVDPKWQRAKETFIAGVEGAPVKHDKMVESADLLFKERIDKVVGQKTPDGKEIVRAELNDFVPSEDNESVRLDLKLWAKGKNGKVTEYTAPATSNRRTDDQMVRDIPLDEALGYVKGLDIMDKAVDKDRLRDVIRQEHTLAGADAADSDESWVRGPGNTLFNRDSGAIKRLRNIGDDTERRMEAMKMARETLEESRSYGRLTDDEKAAKRQALAQSYMDWAEGAAKPGDRVTIDDPSPGVVRALREADGAMIAPSGQYKGREIRLQDDGSVVIEP